MRPGARDVVSLTGLAERDSEGRAEPAYTRRVGTARASAFLGVLLLGTAFGASLDGDFVWDDASLIEHNAAMTRADGWRTIATRDLWGGATGNSTQLYHPVPMLTLWAQARVSGVRVWPLRLGNLGIHALAVVCLAAWLARHGLPIAVTATAALLLLVHPSVTEPVMWLTGRHDLLGVLCTLAGLWSWPQGDAPVRAGRALVAGVAFGAAFLCKEPYLVAFALPVLLTMCTCARARRRPRAHEVARLAIALLPVLAAVGLRLGLGISLGATQARAPIAEQARHFAGVVLHYAMQFARFGDGPTIAPYTPIAPLAAVATWAVMLAITGALGVLAWKNVRHFPVACFGWAWFLVALAPHVVSVPSLGLFGNRYGYFALFGLVVCASGLVASLPPLSSARMRAFARAAVVALGVTLAFATSVEARAWRSNLELYGRDLERDPSNGHALYHYATAVLDRDGCAKALPLFILASELAPNYSRPFHNAAGCAIDTQQPALALRFARHEIALAPENGGAHYNLAVALFATGDARAATQALREALRLDPKHAAARRLQAQMERPHE